MQPYYTFAKMPKDKQKLLAIELPGAQTAILVDHYCTNPNCDCQDVLMELCEFTTDKTLDETSNKKGLRRMASFLVNTENWGVHDLEVYEKNRPIASYIEEFSHSLTETEHALLHSRVQEAKAYGREHTPSPLELGYQPGQCVGFIEVYPEHTPAKFQFEHRGTQYLVDDQYCIDPACKCNEAILTYIPLTQDNTTASNHRFTLRLSLPTGKYTLEFVNGYGTAEIGEIHNRYLQHIHRDLGLFRGRYAKMKEYGHTMATANKSVLRNVPVVTSVKVGRNAPCPCGSGKKFKKCCGMHTGA